MSKRNLVFIIILIASFLVRIQHLDFPLSDIFWWGDGTRDFLVANHILKYREYPLVGPYNLLYESGVRNSPLYFYTLALLLIPFNHPITLTFFNICFQIAVLVLIYFIARKIFNSSVALSAMALYSFSSGVIKQSDYIWQPYLMQPIAFLSLYFLIKAYVDKNYDSNRSYKFFIASEVTFCLAAALHLSVLAWFPIFLITGIILLKGRPLKYFLGSFAIILVSILLLYAPTITFQVFNNLSSPLIVNSIGQYFNNLALNLTEIFNMLNISFSHFFVFIVLSIAAFVFGIIRSKWFILTIIMFFVSVIFASFINKIRPNYLILSLGPFIIWVTLLATLSSQKLSRIFVFLLLFIIFSGNLNFFREANPLGNLRYIEKITDKILVELNYIKKSNNLKSFNFFRVRSFAFENRVLDYQNKFFEYPALDSMLLVPLENKLKQKLTKVSNESPYNHIQINKGNYIFVSCYIFNVSGGKISCKDEFFRKYTDYTFLKTVYLDKNLEIYLLTHRPHPTWKKKTVKTWCISTI